MPLQSVPAQAVQGPIHVLAGQGYLSPLHPVVQRRALLHDERIAGNVLGPQIQGGVQGFPHVLRGLARQAQHQIQVQVVDPRRPGEGSRLAHARQVVNAAQGPQQFRLGGLHAHGQAVAAALPQRPGKLRRQRARIALHRPFGVGRDGKALPQRPGDAPIQRRRQQRGRAPAEKHRVRRRMPAGLCPLPDLPAQRLRIPLPVRLPPRPGRKIAVGALAGAEGDVDV